MPKGNWKTVSVASDVAKNSGLESREYSDRKHGDYQKSNHSNYFKRPPVEQPSPRYKSIHRPTSFSDSSLSSSSNAKQQPATRFQSGPGPRDHQKRYPSSSRHYNKTNHCKNKTNQNWSSFNSKKEQGEKSHKYLKKNTDNTQTISSVIGGLSTNVNNRNHLSVCQSEDANKSTYSMFKSITENQYEQDLNYDSDLSDVSGDLEKLHMMTAADFDRDRYARYGVHESEIKDYVRTITYMNSIEYCTDKFIKVNTIMIKCTLYLGFKISNENTNFFM